MTKAQLVFVDVLTVTLAVVCMVVLGMVAEYSVRYWILVAAFTMCCAASLFWARELWRRP